MFYNEIISAFLVVCLTIKQPDNLKKNIRSQPIGSQDVRKNWEIKVEFNVCGDMLIIWIFSSEAQMVH